MVANWTDIEDQEGYNIGTEVLYLTLCYGTGPVEGRVAGKTFINDRDINDFDDITLYERLGTLDQSAIFNTHKNEYRPENLVCPQNDPKMTATRN